MTTNLPTKTETPTHGFGLDSGHPSLDLANTLEGRLRRRIEEFLPDYRALLSFAAALDLIDDDTHDRLANAAHERPHEATAVHAAALSLREAIFEVASTLVDGDQPDTANLQIIARTAAAAHAAGDFIHEGEGFRWSWDGSPERLEQPLWLLADAALDLFSNQDLTRLRMCAADDCAWLFLDETRNRSRKWCDMATCGNRAKVARYRSREQGIGNSRAFVGCR